jgi:hypothetical protein
VAGVNVRQATFLSVGGIEESGAYYRDGLGFTVSESSRLQGQNIVLSDRQPEHP